MKAFVVSVNGERFVTAGIGPEGVLTTILTWVGGGSRRTAEGDIHFHVGGLDGRTEEHLTWSTPELQLGDTITVEIVEAACVDPVSKRAKRDDVGGG
jgi:hypothetical protein